MSKKWNILKRISAGLLVFALLLMLPVQPVLAKDPGESTGYDYDESDQERVHVIATVSNDGIPIKGYDDDATTLAHVDIDIPWFSLEPYGLEQFDRYHANPEDGTYKVDFNTDSGMFHENPDYNDGKATLTVKDGKMTVHITLNSKNIVQLFLGSAEDAQKDGADLIDPSETTEITYSDGSAPEEVYSFDVPVPTLDDEFDLALIGTKGKWYDHKVSVSNPELVQ